VTLVGTTDVDHTISLQNEPAISLEETAYLMAAVEAEFPALGLELRDVISTYAGVRPVIGSGKADPSQESRDHVVWLENGLLTVTGGKLTTFRLIALDALQILHERFPDFPQPAGNLPMLDRIDHPLAGAQALDENIRRRLLGRYGACAPSLVKSALPGELTPIHGTPYLWAELRWSARMEGVVHLHDLLLRRVRLGLLLPQGGRDLLPTIREICQAELGWDDCRWEVEVSSYLALWDQYYKPPAAASVPDWRAHLDRVRAERLTQRQLRKQRATRQSALATMAIIAAIASFFLYRQISRSKRARRLVR
jgi:glycerol-3-phosphate dehydrogenase